MSFGSISTANLSCRSIDGILQVQSFLAKLPQAFPVYISDGALDDLFTLSIDFSETGLDRSYDPCRSVDYFVRGKIHKNLCTSHNDWSRSETVRVKLEFGPSRVYYFRYVTTTTHSTCWNQLVFWECQQASYCSKCQLIAPGSIQRLIAFFIFLYYVLND